MSTVIDMADYQNTHHNPLDQIEDLLISHDWSFDRLDEEELSIVLETDTGVYHLVMQWLQPRRALQISCRIPQIIPEDKLPDAYVITNEINGHSWLGHFMIDRQEASPVFTYTSLFNNKEAEDDPAYLSRLIDSTIDQCEQMAPLYACLETDQPVDVSSLTLVMGQHAGHA